MADPTTSPAPAPAAPITNEQLHAAIEAARLQEREKLRGDISSLQEQRATVTAERDAAQQRLSDAETRLSSTADKLKILTESQKAAGGFDTDKAVDAVAALTAKRLEETYGAQLRSMASQLDETRKQLTLAEGERLRTRLITEAGGSAVLVPELVAGNTAEEIRASIEVSKAAFQRVATVVGAKTATQPATGFPSLPAPTPTPAPQVISQGSVRGLSMKDYAANRAALRANALASAPRA